MTGVPRLVVGVEVHVQLSTRTKAFCGCPAGFGAEPNTAGCPVCLGHPGALPVLNRGALEAALRGGLALGCTPAPKGRTLWDRKNYFYPDLPKGFQITQYEFPLCEDGAVVLADGTRVRIRRAHLEEDTGKSSHAGDGETLVDFNRCGVPLLEIVSEPDLGSPAEVEEYLRLLQERLRSAGASECSMEKGQMRCEPNVSLARGDGSSTGISELKNLNSFAAAREAVAAEAKRLADGPWHAKGMPLPRATYGWDDGAKRTILQRTKESAADYRYFQEPDLPVLPAEALAPFVARARADLAAREAARKTSSAEMSAFTLAYGISAAQAKALLERDITRGRYVASVKAAVERGVDAVQAGRELAKWFLGPVAGRVNARGGDWEIIGASGADFADAYRLLQERHAPFQVIKEHLLSTEWVEVGGSPELWLSKKGIPFPQVIAPEGTPGAESSGESHVHSLEEVCSDVIAQNMDVVEKIRGGKLQAKAALVGKVMKETRGTADPAQVNRILDRILSS